MTQEPEEEEPFVSVEQEMAKAFAAIHPDTPQIEPESKTEKPDANSACPGSA